jgi:AcrR family transcriptional regulator
MPEATEIRKFRAVAHNHRPMNKSRKLLHQALISLISERNYESITVQQILDRAGVGRSTFYTHFRDKDELLVMGFEHLRETLRRVQTKTPAADSSEKVIGFSLAMFEHLYEYRNEWRILRGSMAGVIVRQSIQDMIENLIGQEFKAEPNNRKSGASKIPSELFVHYLASTFMSVAAWWLDSKNPLAPDAVNDIYRALVTPSLKLNFG